MFYFKRRYETISSNPTIPRRKLIRLRLWVKIKAFAFSGMKTGRRERIYKFNRKQIKYRQTLSRSYQEKSISNNTISKYTILDGLSECSCSQ